MYNNVYILKNGIDINSNVQKWRLYVMKKLYDNVSYIDNIDNVTNKENCVLTYFKISFNHWDYLKYNPNPIFL
jgi:hypothetical protein